MAGDDAGRRPPAVDFPANLRVLLVDDDRACLILLKKMLQDCCYHVIACQSGEEALETLRNSEDGFDIVMTDVRMPGIDGLQLLAEIATMNIESPVILFSDEPEYETISKGVHGGAGAFLAKPIHISTLKIIWKHLLHKTKSATGLSSAPITSSVLHSDQQTDYYSVKRKTGSDSTDCDSLKEIEQDQSNVTEAATGTKKPRMSWKPEVHNAFLEAIVSFGPQKPLPKKIQEYMEAKHGIMGLTRQIISSHLQKHRENMKKRNGIPSNLNINKQSTTGYGVRAPPPPLRTSSQSLSSISWETKSRQQAPTTQVYSQPMYQMETQPNHLQRFLGNPFPQIIAGGYDAYLPSQPPARQTPWNPSIGPTIREQSYPGVRINSTIHTTPANIYNAGMESCGQQLPPGSSSGVYRGNESCRSNALAQGEFMDRGVPAMTLEQEVAENWLKELSFEAMFQDSAFW